MDRIRFVADDQDAGARVDVALAARAAISRAAAERLIAAGEVTVDGAVVAKSLRLQPGMTVESAAPSGAGSPQPEDIPVPVVLEDDHLLVISKPAGLVVHPAPGHTGGTLVNALLARDADGLPAGGDDEERPGIVHRLDAGTSGLMIVAKDDVTHEALTRMMAERTVTRIYLALVEGSPDTDRATIDGPIGRSPRHRKRMAVVAGGKPAVTETEVLERLPGVSLLEARPRTGRTHQIRVHLAAAGHPIVGDHVYGRSRAVAARLGLERPFLHAHALRFVHPVSGEEIDLTDPLPADLAEALARARAGAAR